MDPAYLTLRSVFEGVTQIYLLHLTDREAELFYKKQIETLTPNDKRELKRRRWLSPAEVRDILYTGTKKEQNEAFYNGISNSAHPSVRGVTMNFELKEDVVVDVLSLTLMLAVSNLIAINESCFEIITKKERGEVLEAIEEVVAELGYISDLIPNNPKMEDKLNFRYS
jgi:hypothetical protein